MMGVLKLAQMVAACLALLFLSDHHASARIKYASPPQLPPPEVSDLEIMMANGLKFDEVNNNDTLCMTCHGLQDEVNQCRGVMPFDEYARENCERLFGMMPPPMTRRKRHSNSWSSFWDWNPFPSNSWGSSWGSSGSYGSGVFLCPTPADQSAVYQLNPDGALYPATDIGQEFLLNPVVGQCLTREIVLPEDPPNVVVEDFRLTANASCPFTQLRLYSYQSLQFGSRCWVLQNFGELILYRQCSQQLCQDCKPPRDRYRSSSSRVNLCFPEYRTVSFSAFCPSFPAGQRFRRDRIIIPAACTCQKTICPRSSQG